jgi:hypothetical protein
MGIRRASITKKIGSHRYALWKDIPLNYDEALRESSILRNRYQSVRIVKLQQGWFLYHYPQYSE